MKNEHGINCLLSIDEPLEKKMMAILDVDSKLIGNFDPYTDDFSDTLIFSLVEILNTLQHQLDNGVCIDKSDTIIMKTQTALSSIVLKMIKHISSFDENDRYRVSYILNAMIRIRIYSDSIITEYIDDLLVSVVEFYVRYQGCYVYAIPRSDKYSFSFDVEMFSTHSDESNFYIEPSDDNTYVIDELESALTSTGRYFVGLYSKIEERTLESIIHWISHTFNIDIGNGEILDAIITNMKNSFGDYIIV